ncbi:hypothetical protein [Streptomyces griseorubiginosus]|uniref:hypothetical protein n=1 Tax=Streptomyces griseorubiginosus TaxID=67304 RepID=UPI0036E16B5B
MHVTGHGSPGPPRRTPGTPPSRASRVLTPKDDLSRTVATATATAVGGGIVVIGFDRLKAAALARVPADGPCASAVEAPPPGPAPEGRRTA